MGDSLQNAEISQNLILPIKITPYIGWKTDALNETESM